MWYDGINIKDWIKRHGKTQELAWRVAQTPSEEKTQIAKAKIVTRSSFITTGIFQNLLHISCV
jgi:hypothetical protein